MSKSNDGYLNYLDAVEEDKDYSVCSNTAVKKLSSGKVKKSTNEKELVAKQWSDMDGCIIPVNNTFPELEPGYYTIEYSNNYGMYFSKQHVELLKPLAHNWLSMHISTS